MSRRRKSYSNQTPISWEDLLSEVCVDPEGRTGPLTADWEDLLGQGARSAAKRNGVPYLDDVPVVTVPCEFVFTAKQGSNSRVFRVRCRCQAQTQNLPSPVFWNYDPLGEVGSLAEGLTLWRAHKDARAINAPES